MPMIAMNTIVTPLTIKRNKSSGLYKTRAAKSSTCVLITNTAAATKENDNAFFLPHIFTDKRNISKINTQKAGSEISNLKLKMLLR